MGGILLDLPAFRNPDVVAAYLWLLGFRATWRNEHLVPSGRHVVVSNHVSVGDLMVLFQRPKRYVHIVTSVRAGSKVSDQTGMRSSPVVVACWCRASTLLRHAVVYHVALLPGRKTRTAFAFVTT